MIKKLKGQGAIEYLLILGAVLVIAAIVTMLVLQYSSAGPETLQKQCQQAMRQAASIKAGSGYSQLSVSGFEAVKSICAPCYKYDKYYIDTGKRENCDSDSVPTLDEILQTPLGSITNINDPITVGSKKIDQTCLPYYYKCLTQAPATL